MIQLPTSLRASCAAGGLENNRKPRVINGAITAGGFLIGTDQDRRYVYIVGKDNAAERRDVTLGPHVEALRVVKTGLAPGDRVIVNGMRKIFFPGQPVAPREVPMNDPNRPAPPAPAVPAAG